jgi:hypothetical protein
MDETWLVPDTGEHAPLKKFGPDEMVTCEACLRANPPTRAQCMYCGAAFQPEASSMPTAEVPVAENKPAYYVILRPGTKKSPADTILEQLANRFRMKTEELRAAIVMGTPVPVTGSGSQDDSQRVVDELRNLGFDSRSISDADLKTTIPEKNIRLLEFSETGLTGISKNGRERWIAAWHDLSLIVTGRLIAHRVEIDEKRSRASVKSLDRRELTQDRSVIDLYLTSSDVPWRIAVNEFDFSCLGERKSLTVFDNAKVLIDFLVNRSQAQVNDSYVRVKAVLANVWPLQSATKEGRSQRPRAGRKEISTVTASDNEEQFNNYSRMVWCWKRQSIQDSSD